MTVIEQVMLEYDQTQVELMNEVCIKVNEQDVIEGSISKKACKLDAVMWC
jgi:hypothetical protein